MRSRPDDRTLLDRVVNDLGTKTALARELGIKVQALVGWWSRGIPRHAAARVRLLVEDKPRAGSRQDDSPFMEVPLVGTAAGGPPSKRHAQMRRVPAYAPWATLRVLLLPACSPPSGSTTVDFRIRLLSYRTAMGWRPFALVKSESGARIPDAPVFISGLMPTKVDADDAVAALGRHWIDQRAS